MKNQTSNSDLGDGSGLASDGLPMWATQEQILEEDMKTYSEDEVEALVQKAVADATAELSTKLAGIEAEKTDAEKAEVATQMAELDEKIKELHAKLDTAVLETANANQEKADLVAYLESVNADAERAAEIASLRTERVAKVAEVAAFPQEYLDANTDRWAAMTEQDFEAAVADYAVVAKKDSGTNQIPSGTALTATKEVSTNEGSAFGAIFSLRSVGVDARTIL